MDFTKYRQSAITAYELGMPDRLLEQLSANALNEMERKFIAGILRASVPKGSTGPSKGYEKPVKAALIWFWQHEVEKHRADSVEKAIETALGVKNSMARKYVRQIESPKTEGERLAKIFAAHEITKRRQALAWGDEDLIRLYRQRDLAPIVRK